MDVKVDSHVHFPQAPAVWNRDRIYRVAAVYSNGMDVECDGHRYTMTTDEADQMGITLVEQCTTEK